MRVAGFIWGIGGVLALLLSAVWRITPRVLELGQYRLGVLHWLLLASFTLYMLYAEGYKGFHRNFSPRVALRANYLRREGKGWQLLLAPFICMGYLHATRKRKIVSLSLTIGLIVLIVAVSHLAQPWRGIIDAGVVAGLVTGCISLVYFVIQVLKGQAPAHVSADLP